MPDSNRVNLPAASAFPSDGSICSQVRQLAYLRDAEVPGRGGPHSAVPSTCKSGPHLLKRRCDKPSMKTFDDVLQIACDSKERPRIARHTRHTRTPAPRRRPRPDCLHRCCGHAIHLNSHRGDGERSAGPHLPEVMGALRMLSMVAISDAACNDRIELNVSA